MAVNTKSVAGRRDVKYRSYDELLTDLDRLVDSEVQLLGNWSLGQIIKHLQLAIVGSIDGITFKAPSLVKFGARTFMKKRFIYGAIPAGFKIPKSAESQFLPEGDVSTDVALAELRKTIERIQADPNRCPHPIFGKLTRDEWDNLNFRHAEMHLSFVIPVE